MLCVLHAVVVRLKNSDLDDVQVPSCCNGTADAAASELASANRAQARHLQSTQRDNTSMVRRMNLSA